MNSDTNPSVQTLPGIWRHCKNDWLSSMARRAIHIDYYALASACALWVIANRAVARALADAFAIGPRSNYRT
jgi:hypothetical protein